MADDGELRDERELRWLQAHLSECARCELAQEVIAEAGESYRSWLPLAAVPWLLDAAEAEAAERDRELARRWRRRGVRTLAAVAAAVLVTAGVAATSVDRSEPAAAAPFPAETAARPERAPGKRRPESTRTREPARTPAPAGTAEATRHAGADAHAGVDAHAGADAHTRAHAHAPADAHTRAHAHPSAHAHARAHTDRRTHSVRNRRPAGAAEDRRAARDGSAADAGGSAEA